MERQIDIAVPVINVMAGGVEACAGAEAAKNHIMIVIIILIIIIIIIIIIIMVNGRRCERCASLRQSTHINDVKYQFVVAGVVVAVLV